MLEELKGMIPQNERILYEGKPEKKCFILKTIFGPMIFLVILWCTIDIPMLITAITSKQVDMIVFLVIHILMEYCIYLGNVVFFSQRYQNANYIVTDHGIYISSGVFSKQCNVKTFAELNRIAIHRGVFDQILGVGDVRISTAERTEKGTGIYMRIDFIKDYKEVYQLLNKLQADIYSDTMYPNNMRPEENHGYRTKYKGL